MNTHYFRLITIFLVLLLLTTMGYAALPDGRGDTEPVRVCPDDSIEMLFATSQTNISEIVKAVNRAYELATNHGIKAKKIIGKDVNAKLIKDYLSCPNVKMVYLFEHTISSAILFSDQTSISASWFMSQSKTFMEGKSLYIVGGQLHETIMVPAIMQCGTYALLGNKLDLGLGNAEYAATCWLDRIVNCTEMEKAAQLCSEEQHEPADYITFHGKGSGPWYYAGCVEPTPTPTPPVNLALNKPVVTSGEYSPQYAGRNINDGDTNTIWGSEYGAQYHWMYIDLEKEESVSVVTINFYNPYHAATYAIALSNDGINWTLEPYVTNGDGHEDTYRLNKKTRYIGIYMTEGKYPAYGIAEFAVYTQ